MNGAWRELLSGRHLGVVTVLAGGVALYATNVYLTAGLLPTAIDDIGGLQFYAWTSVAFLIGSVASATVVSRTLGARGPRGAYLTGLALFALGSTVCAASPSMEVLLVGRGLQGLGGGLLAGLGYATINLALPPRLWTRASGLVSAMWGVGTFAGPTIGGAFAQFGSWRAAFAVLVVATATVAVLVPLALPRKTGSTDTPGRLPVMPFALLIAATTAVAVGGIVGNAAVSALAVAGACALVVAFVAADRRSPAGVLPSSTFGPSRLRWVYLTVAALAAASTVETFVPLFGDRLAGLAPLPAGFLGAALALGWTLGELSSAAVSGPSAVRRIVRGGPLVVACGLLSATLLVPDGADTVRIAGWAVGLALAGAGIGLAWPHLTVAAMASATGVEGAQAAAGINTVQLVANAFGAALAGVLVNLGGLDVRSAQVLFGAFAGLAVAGVELARRATPRPAPPPGPDRAAASGQPRARAACTRSHK
ncbi:MFS transporter [Rhodococcus sp. SGAir0479]|uniref:MFS transporter n=1 Tax=Rhodococcus sp. SGAir0479 TaxID=2567884 RepID=UPI0010CD692B|nr:MFS transporter [Rhodococcus sp. SGAir0479]QCQ93730.1 MFS transporter [Rhodococcus sp. SGAir0479]